MARKAALHQQATINNAEHSGVGHRPTGDGAATGRLEAFSDGVFAVAITLLVLDIKVPAFEGDGPNTVHSTAEMATYLANQMPSYIGYLLSFVVIGNTWLAHHLLFNYINRVDRTLISLNLLLLMMVAFVPFTTLLLADTLQHGIGQQLAAVIYSGTLFVQGIFYNAIWLYSSRNYRLLDRTADPKHVHTLTRRFMLWPLFYLISIVLSFISVEASLLIYIFVPLAFFLPSATDRF